MYIGCRQKKHYFQELGGSNSSYSIKDQLKLNPALNDEKGTPTFEDLKNLVKKMQKKWEVSFEILSIRIMGKKLVEIIKIFEKKNNLGHCQINANVCIRIP